MMTEKQVTSLTLPWGAGNNWEGSHFSYSRLFWLFLWKANDDWEASHVPHS